MIEANDNPTAQKLLEAFSQFKKLHMKQSPVEGLTSGEVMMMFTIKKNTMPDEPGIKVSEISNFLKVAPPSITQMINNLEKEGYVERTMDKADRRAVRVRLTDKGREAVLEGKEAFHSMLYGLIEFLGEEKSNELAELLQQVYFYFDLKKDNNKNL
jgi:DNA-binding MarR family transcriptional regulator